MLRGKLATGEGIEVHQTTLPPGGAPTATTHHHPHSEMWLIREGTIELTVNGQEVPPGAGVGRICRLERRARNQECRHHSLLCTLWSRLDQARSCKSRNTSRNMNVRDRESLMTIHIGLIGGGNITETHARAARAIAGVEIAAIYGTNAEQSRGPLPRARREAVPRLRRIPGASPDGPGRDRKPVRTACCPGHCRGAARPSCADREADRYQHRARGCAYRSGGALRSEAWRHVSGPREARNPGTPRVDQHGSDRQTSAGGCAGEMVPASGILQRLALARDVSRWMAAAR